MNGREQTGTSGRAKTRADLVTRAKLVVISALANRWLRLDADGLCERWYGCPARELSRARTSSISDTARNSAPTADGQGRSAQEAARPTKTS